MIGQCDTTATNHTISEKYVLKAFGLFNQIPEENIELDIGKECDLVQNFLAAFYVRLF